MDYYTKYIQNNPDWEFVEVYTDEGISATSTKRRDGFNRMIQDALDGKIDLIITKSVSRFARNTVDTLTTVRQLKEKGIEVYFEKENIHTLDSKDELLITIMSSLAQEESRCGTPWLTASRFTMKPTSASFSKMERNAKYKSIKRTPHYHYTAVRSFSIYSINWNCQIHLLFLAFFSTSSCITNISTRNMS